LFVDLEAYHEQMGPIPSSDGSLDIALSIVHTYIPQRRTFQIVDAPELASGWEINTAVGVCVDFSAYPLMFGKSS